MLATEAQLNVRPTGNQEVAGLTPAKLATFFMKYFLVILFLPLIQKGQLSISVEKMCTILVNR